MELAIIAVALIFVAFRDYTNQQERKELISSFIKERASLLDLFAKERQKHLDRIMAHDLTDLKDSSRPAKNELEVTIDPNIVNIEDAREDIMQYASN